MKRIMVLLAIFLGIFQISYGNIEIDNRIKEINKIVEKINSSIASEIKKKEGEDTYTKYYDQKKRLVKISKSLGQFGPSRQEDYYIDKNRLIKYFLNEEFPILDANPPSFYRNVLEYYFSKSGKLIAIIDVNPNTDNQEIEYSITKTDEEKVKEKYKDTLEKSR